MEQNEIWKDIEGYEGLYEVSSLGRVRSLDRIDGAGHLRKGKILKPKLEPSGYLRVTLHKESIGKCFRINRLVASAFIPNPNGYPVVNHRDEDKTNDRADNLEWCTVRYNNNYGTRNERIVQTKINNGTYNEYLVNLKKKDVKLYNRERDRIWRENNPEKKRESSRRRYYKDIEKSRKYAREWASKHRRRKKKPIEESLW